MKESDWNDCIESSSSIKITPDKQKAKSLVKVAEGRIKYLYGQKINSENSNYIFEGLYTSINEFVHAIAFLEGYKVNNHVCLGFFIRDFLKKEELFRLFDDCRYRRNSLVYYGNDVDFQTAKQSIDRAKRLIKELKEIVEKPY